MNVYDRLDNETLKYLGNNPTVLRNVAKWISCMASSDAYLDAKWAYIYLNVKAQGLEKQQEQINELNANTSS
ncbi:MAG TPA: hypothetical protein VHD33_08270 [Legionellaceae bacterium]|nr:hypothetical protein [Legionellaceae bacterium]